MILLFDYYFLQIILCKLSLIFISYFYLFFEIVDNCLNASLPLPNFDIADSFFSFESPVQKTQGSQQQNQINFPQNQQESTKKCNECGNGVFNLCDEDECISFGKCKFLDRIGPINECTDV